MVVLKVWTRCATFLMAAILSLPAARAGTAGEEPAREETASAVPSDLADAVRAASSLGRELFYSDRLARLGVEALLRARQPLDSVDGWLIGREIGGGLLVFFATTEEDPRLVYLVSDRGSFEREDPPQPLGRQGAKPFLAQRAALRAVGGSDEPMNRILLTGDAIGKPGTTLVYLLSDSENADQVLLGPHYRVVVGPKGDDVLETTPLSLSRGAVARSSVESASGEASPGVLFAQCTTETPNEVHVYLSLLHGGLPLTVMTSRGAWRIEGEWIRFLGWMPAKP